MPSTITRNPTLRVLNATVRSEEKCFRFSRMLKSNYFTQTTQPVVINRYCSAYACTSPFIYGDYKIGGYLKRKLKIKSGILV